MNCLYLAWNKMTSAQDVSVMVSSSHFTELQKLSLLGKKLLWMSGTTTELQLLAVINKAVLTLKIKPVANGCLENAPRRRSLPISC